MKLEYFRSLSGTEDNRCINGDRSYFFSIKNSSNSVLFYKIARFGNSGVLLFFVLSGL